MITDQIVESFGKEKLIGLVKRLKLNLSQFEINSFFVSKGTTCVECLPFRIYIYDLSDYLSSHEFNSINENIFRITFEAAAVVLDNCSYGYHLFSIQNFSDIDSSKNFEDQNSYLYNFSKDWERLILNNTGIDYAYNILWLRKLYTEYFQMIAEAFSKKEVTVRFAAGMTFLCDESMYDLAVRICARNESEPHYFRMLTMFNTFFKSYGYPEIGKEKNILARQVPTEIVKKNLRDNPIIAALYAIRSPYFHSLSLESIKILFQDEMRIKNLVTKEDVQQVNDFITHFLDDVSSEEMLIFTRLAFVAAQNFGDEETQIFAANNLGLVLTATNSNFVEEYDKLLPIYKKLKQLEPEHFALEGVKIWLKKLKERIDCLEDSSEDSFFGELNATQYLSLEQYNQMVAERKFEEAITLITELLKELQEKPLSKFRLNVLLGSLLTSTNRYNDAIRILKDSERDIIKLSVQPVDGSFEVFKSTLLYKLGRYTECAEFLYSSLQFLEHKFPNHSLISLLVNYIAVLAHSSNPEEAVSMYERYKSIMGFRSDESFRFKANYILALNHLGRYADAIEKIETFNLDLGDISSEVKFDLLWQMVIARLGLFREKNESKTSVEKAFNNAGEFLYAADPFKAHIYYQQKANYLIEIKESDNEVINTLESGLKMAEMLFLQTIRLVDNIYDRDRLIHGFISKCKNFAGYLVLTSLYWKKNDFLRLYSFLQSYKSKFIIETLFSNSENMMAKKLASSFDGSTEKLSDFTNLLSLVSIAFQFDPDGFKKIVDKIDGREISVLPISTEHLTPEFYMPINGNYNRADEISKGTTIDFVHSMLDPNVAILEFFIFDGQKFSILVIRHGAEIESVGPFDNVNFDLEEFQETAIAGVVLEQSHSLINFFNSLDQLLFEKLPYEIDTLVMCPTAGVTNIPYNSFLGDRYNIIIAPSSSLYALAVCRPRRVDFDRCFALVDPCSELVLKKAERQMLTEVESLRFSNISSKSLNWDELTKETIESFLIHISAHGFGSESSVFKSGIKTNEVEGEQITVFRSLFDYFPDINCGLVVLSSCSTGSISTIHDEFLGLPTALILGGAKTVIAPIWEVDEFATLLLINFFYQSLNREKSVANALKGAQKRLRTLSTDEAQKYLDSIEDRSLATSSVIHKYRLFLNKKGTSSNTPFSQPYFWAGFQLYGSDIKLAKVLD